MIGENFRGRQGGCCSRGDGINLVGDHLKIISKVMCKSSLIRYYYRRCVVGTVTRPEDSQIDWVIEILRTTMDIYKWLIILASVWCCVVSWSFFLHLVQWKLLLTHQVLSMADLCLFLIYRLQDLHARRDIISNIIIILSKQAPTINFYILSERLAVKTSNNSGVYWLRYDERYCLRKIGYILYAM